MAVDTHKALWWDSSYLIAETKGKSVVAEQWNQFPFLDVTVINLPVSIGAIISNSIIRMYCLWMLFKEAGRDRNSSDMINLHPTKNWTACKSCIWYIDYLSWFTSCYFSLTIILIKVLLQNTSVIILINLKSSLKNSFPGKYLKLCK